jgi:hypothetical protein
MASQVYDANQSQYQAKLKMQINSKSRSSLRCKSIPTASRV